MIEAETAYRVLWLDSYVLKEASINRGCLRMKCRIIYNEDSAQTKWFRVSRCIQQNGAVFFYRDTLQWLLYI